MENMAFETVEAITEYFNDDSEESRELVKDILFYLYHTTTDTKLMSNIEDWFEEEQYCLVCGGRMALSSYQEYREGFGGCYETIYETFCENCDF